MTGGEDEPQLIVAHVVVQRRVEVCHGTPPFRLQLVSKLLVLAFESLETPEVIDGAMLGGGHQPGGRVAGDARRRPLFERGEERVLRELLGDADVTDHARKPGDELA